MSDNGPTKKSPNGRDAGKLTSAMLDGIAQQIPGIQMVEDKSYPFKDTLHFEGKKDNQKVELNIFKNNSADNVQLDITRTFQGVTHKEEFHPHVNPDGHLVMSDSDRHDLQRALERSITLKENAGPETKVAAAMNIEGDRIIKTADASLQKAISQQSPTVQRRGPAAMKP